MHARAKKKEVKKILSKLRIRRSVRECYCAYSLYFLFLLFQCSLCFKQRWVVLTNTGYLVTNKSGGSASLAQGEEKIHLFLRFLRFRSGLRLRLRLGLGAFLRGRFALGLGRRLALRLGRRLALGGRFFLLLGRRRSRAPLFGSSSFLLCCSSSHGVALFQVETEALGSIWNDQAFFHGFLQSPAQITIQRWTLFGVLVSHKPRTNRRT